MGIDPRYDAFGRAVALRRDQLGMTQAQLSARVGLSRASIANIEAGRQNVLLHHACDIAAVLTYLRASWGNGAPEVTPLDVHRMRTRMASNLR